MNKVFLKDVCEKLTTAGIGKQAAGRAATTTSARQPLNIRMEIYLEIKKKKIYTKWKRK